jgi:hypothetical protein
LLLFFSFLKIVCPPRVDAPRVVPVSCRLPCLFRMKAGNLEPPLDNEKYGRGYRKSMLASIRKKKGKKANGPNAPTEEPLHARETALHGENGRKEERGVFSPAFHRRQKPGPGIWQLAVSMIETHRGRVPAHPGNIFLDSGGIWRISCD